MSAICRICFLVFMEYSELLYFSISFALMSSVVKLVSKFDGTETACIITQGSINNKIGWKGNRTSCLQKK